MENGKVKFCGSCGAKMPETAQFCPKCGGKAPVMPGQSVVQNDAAATAGTPPASPIMPSSATPSAPVTGQTGTTSGHTTGSFSAQGTPPFGGAGYSPQMQTMPQTDLGMNWYKFVIYFALFAQALVLVILSINLFTGGLYGGLADYVYMLFGGLRALDIIFGLVFLALAAMAIYVRQKLAHFKCDAPRLFYAFIIAANAASLVYFWGLSYMLSSVSFYDASSVVSTGVISTTISIIGGCAIWLAINTAYFKKRAHLFVN